MFSVIAREKSWMEVTRPFRRLQVYSCSVGELVTN